MRIVAHCLVKNEENFIWYAVSSVIEKVDEIMVWDTGSRDKTIELINLIDLNQLNKKVKTRFLKSGDISGMRQKMLDETDGDWIFLLDGDEIWWDETIRNLQSTINNCDPQVNLIVVPNYMLIGDIYHYQEKAAGRYQIAGRIGHYNIRAIRKVSGLHVEGIYPDEAYVTQDGIKVQDLPKGKILFLDEPYLHASFLERSSKDNRRVKYEIGEKFAAGFYYPEVFFRPRPTIVPSPWTTMSSDYRMRAFLETPLKKLKRRII